MLIENTFKYNLPGRQAGGKELNETNGLRWYDYGFRRYDPQTGRMHVIDPKAESNQFMSPYIYASNTR
ncbi:MAG: hypothetical protein K9G67_05540 [Bacteroidales bacterium]|nr:hypothetical protein [Bacteroidales bacterium]MCF8344344.1 hypothetical protein [Bacteroidales bacterium]MCF8350923.1 hypothetical protein [Bacteroidales bacterium]MCF8375797.1 hypothetical protein [Bacteroidales bacterium]